MARAQSKARHRPFRRFISAADVRESARATAKFVRDGCDGVVATLAPVVAEVVGAVAVIAGLTLAVYEAHERAKDASDKSAALRERIGTLAPILNELCGHILVTDDEALAEEVQKHISRVADVMTEARKAMDNWSQVRCLLYV